MPEIRAEAADIDARAIAMTGLVLVLIILCVVGASYALLSAWHAKFAGPNAPLDFSVRGAALESAPQLDRARFDAEKHRLIGEYEWVDRAAGVTRIPVDAAMDMLVQQDAGNGKGAAQP
jgi:hypothetical protein